MNLTLKECLICDSEFIADKISQKYCSEKCRLVRNREADRLRKREIRAEERTIRDKENERIQQAKKDAKEKAELERHKAKEQEHQKITVKAEQGDPLARMRLAKPFSVEYWEAYKDYEMESSLKYETKPIRYVNGISVYDDDFAEKVMFMIEEQGFILSELVRSVV